MKAMSVDQDFFITALLGIVPLDSACAEDFLGEYGKWHIVSIILHKFLQYNA